MSKMCQKLTSKWYVNSDVRMGKISFIKPNTRKLHYLHQSNIQKVFVYPLLTSVLILIMFESYSQIFFTCTRSVDSPFEDQLFPFPCIWWNLVSTVQYTFTYGVTGSHYACSKSTCAYISKFLINSWPNVAVHLPLFSSFHREMVLSLKWLVRWFPANYVL